MTMYTCVKQEISAARQAEAAAENARFWNRESDMPQDELLNKEEKGTGMRPDAGKTERTPVKRPAGSKSTGHRPQGTAAGTHPRSKTTRSGGERPHRETADRETRAAGAAPTSDGPVDEAEERRRRRRAAKREEARRRKRRVIMIRRILAGAAALLVVLILFFAIRGITGRSKKTDVPGEDVVVENAETTGNGEGTGEGTAILEPTSTPTPIPTPTPLPDIPFNPQATENTKATNLIAYTEVMSGGESVDDRESRAPWFSFDFGVGSEYTDVEGIITFRGNNFRDSAQYGTAEMKDYTISKIWERETGSLEYNGHVWSGNGWTGQPLIVKWPEGTKKAMNLYDSAKAKEDLVEVIYASMDGYIYFTDLETGEKTRDSMYVGWTFKGAGALDPRGYPILYVGAGYNSEEGISRVFIINLLDCSVMYTFGNLDSFSLRGTLSYFDSSALVDAETDTLVYPGENGILYFLKLNSSYDETTGTLTFDPGTMTKWRYWGHRSGDEKYWLGMEDSCCIYKGYLFVCDNGGHLMCINLKTLRVVWAQDILDDSNGSPVLSIEDNHLYLYVSTSFHLGWRSDTTATVPIWKIDAENGEIVWHTDYECYSESGVSGGVQSTPAVGQNDLSDYVYVTVSKVGDVYEGLLTCLNKKTGDIVWEHKGVYTWSSPVCVYNSDGSGAVLYFTFEGKGFLLDGVTGEVKSEILLENGSVEASPAVYKDKVVIGTRDCRIYGLDLN